MKTFFIILSFLSAFLGLSIKGNHNYQNNYPSVCDNTANFTILTSDQGYLVDEYNRTLYIRWTDQGKYLSTCYDICILAWPALQLPRTNFLAGPCVQQSLISVIQRVDGGKQIAYNGWPLYYLNDDGNPGIVNGAEIFQLASYWFLINGDGTVVFPNWLPNNKNFLPVSYFNLTNDYQDFAFTRSKLKTETGSVGTYVTNGLGRTLYIITADLDFPGKSVCYDLCAEFWPPVISVFPAEIGQGINKKKVSFIIRRDGLRQLTYYGIPLYYYYGDRVVGDAQGQGALEYGGLWYLINSQAEPITSIFTTTGQ
jgi:predicted lipoprotein with Yx(FWY)xxD motif